jgi:hypothetical protein
MAAPRGNRFLVAAAQFAGWSQRRSSSGCKGAESTESPIRVAGDITKVVGSLRAVARDVVADPLEIVQASGYSTDVRIAP